MKTECSCEKCVQACKRYPGWMTVAEAERAIAAGLARKLMLDYWADDPNVYVLIPAMKGSEGKEMAFLGFLSENARPCVMLKDDRCTLHDTDFKPLMCRAVFACAERAAFGTEKKDFLEDWTRPEGLTLIERWKELVGWES